MLDLRELTESSQAILEILALNLDEEGLRASEIAQIAHFSRQTIYQELEKLSKKGLVAKAEKDGVLVFTISDEDLRWHILGTLRESQEIFSKDGKLRTSFKTYGRSKLVFCEPGYLPDSLSTLVGGRASVYGCRINLEPISTSQIGFLLGLEENIAKAHMELMGTFWAIESSRSDDIVREYNIGVGTRNLMQSLLPHNEAIIRLIFAVQEDMGGYFGIIYFLEGKKILHTIDSLRLTILSPKIPLGKSFATGLRNIGILPYVETYRVEREQLLTEPFEINSEHIVGFLSDPRYKTKVARAAVLRIPPNNVNFKENGFGTLMAWAPLPLIDECLEKKNPLWLTHFVRFSFGPSLIPTEFRDSSEIYFGLLHSIPEMSELPHCARRITTLRAVK